MEIKIERREIPTLFQALVFKAKASLLQAKRGAENLLHAPLRRFPLSGRSNSERAIAESKTALWTETEAEERFLIAGKIENLRRAAARINGAAVPAGAVFSFWRQVGRATRRRGFVTGRELREGCLIPNVGGGLCQLSNALYDAALQANFEIVERHAHTQVIRGSLAETGRDATVFWNYVDLRFRAEHAFRIEVKLDAQNLIVRFHADKPKAKPVFQIQKFRAGNAGAETHAGSCATCGVEECFRAVEPSKYREFGRTAFLVDEYSPELDKYIKGAKRGNDLLFLPLDGKRFKKANYAWTTAGFAEVRQSFPTTLIRAYSSRKLAAQGAARQKNLLAMAEKLADSYARRLGFDVLHLVVAQNLLPFLWRSGALGGRTFDVLMTNIPVKYLQERLDFAHSLHPESTTLADFRADRRLVEDELEALKHARRIITPHTFIAALFPDKTELLNWQLPKIKERRQKTRNPKPVIVFPASTVGRKGIYELREALRGFDAKLIVAGAMIEDANFWRGFDVTRAGASNGWLDDADLVVLPSFVENRPRRLLEAAAGGVPVIASNACGVENIEGIEIIEAGDAESLRGKLAEFFARS